MSQQIGASFGRTIDMRDAAVPEAAVMVLVARPTVHSMSR